MSNNKGNEVTKTHGNCVCARNEKGNNANQSHGGKACNCAHKKGQGESKLSEYYRGDDKSQNENEQSSDETDETEEARRSKK